MSITADCFFHIEKYSEVFAEFNKLTITIEEGFNLKIVD